MLFDFATLPAQDRYKLLVSTVVPRPIAWVVTCDIEGRLNAAPYSFFNVFANDPPVLCIGVGGRAPNDMKDTGNNIRATGQFVVNLVSAETASAMNVSAIDFPRIAESPVAMECELFSTMELSPERLLIFGRVLAMHIKDEAVLNPQRCYIDTPKLDLIGRMHGAGGYIRTADMFEMPRIKPQDWVRKAAE